MDSDIVAIYRTGRQDTEGTQAGGVVVAAFVSKGFCRQYGNSPSGNGIEGVETLQTCRLTFGQTGGDDTVLGCWK